MSMDISDFKGKNILTFKKLETGKVYSYQKLEIKKYIYHFIVICA